MPNISYIHRSRKNGECKYCIIQAIKQFELDIDHFTGDRLGNSQSSADTWRQQLWFPLRRPSYTRIYSERRCVWRRADQELLPDRGSMYTGIQHECRRKIKNWYIHNLNKNLIYCIYHTVAHRIDLFTYMYCWTSAYYGIIITFRSPSLGLAYAPMVATSFFELTVSFLDFHHEYPPVLFSSLLLAFYLCKIGDFCNCLLFSCIIQEWSRYIFSLVPERWNIFLTTKPSWL